MRRGHTAYVDVLVILGNALIFVCINILNMNICLYIYICMYTQIFFFRLFRPWPMLLSDYMPTKYMVY